MHAPFGHTNSSGEQDFAVECSQLASSSLSSQSLCLSHLHLIGMHFPLLHLKLSLRQLFIFCFGLYQLLEFSFNAYKFFGAVIFITPISTIVVLVTSERGFDALLVWTLPFIVITSGWFDIYNNIIVRLDTDGIRYHMSTDHIQLRQTHRHSRHLYHTSNSM